MKIKGNGCEEYIDTPKSILAFFDPISRRSFSLKKLFVKKAFVCPNCQHEHLKDDIVETDSFWGEAILEEIYKDFLLVIHKRDETYIANKANFSDKSAGAPLSNTNLAHLLWTMKIEIQEIKVENGNTSLGSFNYKGKLDGSATIGNHNRNKSSFTHNGKELRVAVIGNGVIVKNM